MKLKISIFAFFCFSLSNSAWSQEIYWFSDGGAPGEFPTPASACDATMQKIYAMEDEHFRYKFAYLLKRPYDSVRPSLREYSCRFTTFYKTSEGVWEQFNSFGANDTRIIRSGDTCPPGFRENSETYICEDLSISQENMQYGDPEKILCPSSTPQLGVINFGTGNIYQVEDDFRVDGVSPVEFKTYYNSASGARTHTYQTYLSIIGESNNITLAKPNGKRVSFSVSGSIAKGDGTETGYLEKLGDGWTYTNSANEKQTFNFEGRLTSFRTSNGVVQSISYADEGKVSVNDNLGNSLVFTQDSQSRPLTVHVAGLDIKYQYNSSNQLYRVERTRNGQTESRTYHYEVANKPMLLTGITDERGVRSAIWTYDDQGRAISIEHAGGTGKYEVSYSADGSSTVTNELGKKTVYRYNVIQGVKHIVAVEGEPSANCPASNSTYTYNDRGQVLTKTDAKGFITTHAYNDRGLETSLTEATGTPQARTTTTTWHATFNLPLTVTEPGQRTTYTYDAQGRQTGRTQTAL